MRIPQTSMQRIKVGIHLFQGLLSAIGACLGLAVLVMEGSNDGRIGFYFAMCLLTIPALIYLTMVPLWTRARLFQNAYIYAILDISYTILWLAAFASVAAWEANGLSQGSNSSDDDNDGKEKRQDSTESGDGGDEDKSSKSGCEAFGFGSATKCQVSRAMIGMGVLLWLTFCLTSYLSIRGIIRFRETGELPGSKRGVHKPRQHEGARRDSDSSHSGHEVKINPTAKEHDAWSTDTGDIEPPRPHTPFDTLRSQHSQHSLPYIPDLRSHDSRQALSHYSSSRTLIHHPSSHTLNHHPSSHTLNHHPSSQTLIHHPSSHTLNHYSSTHTLKNTLPRPTSRSANPTHHTLLHHKSTEYNPHPGRQLSYSSGGDDDDNNNNTNDLHSPHKRISTPSFDPLAQQAPSALSPGVYDPRDAHGRVSFPRGFWGSEFR